MTIQIISGTNRPNNMSLVLARAYQESLSAAGVSASLIDLTDLPQDILATDLYGNRSDAFQPFQDRIKENEHFIFIVPEYNGSIPGILKIFIDACDYPDTFVGKQAWLVGLGAGDGGNVAGLSHLRDILEFLGTRVHPEQATYSKIRERMDGNGKFMDNGLPEELTAQVRTIAAVLSEA